MLQNQIKEQVNVSNNWKGMKYYKRKYQSLDMQSYWKVVFEVYQRTIEPSLDFSISFSESIAKCQCLPNFVQYIDRRG
jgi:hypothetical protein